MYNKKCIWNNEEVENLQGKSDDIRIELENLKKLIEGNGEVEEIKAKQLKINESLEEYLKDMK